MADSKTRKETVNVNDLAKPAKLSDTERLRADIEKLGKDGDFNPKDIADLYRKYSDQDAIISEISRYRRRKLKQMSKVVKQVAEKINKKYVQKNRPLHEILNLMMKYKKKNNWSEAEFELFRKHLSSMLTGNYAHQIDHNQEIPANRSRINRLLRNDRIELDDGLKIKDTEGAILNEILKLYESSLNAYRAVFMSSLMYEDCSLVAMTGKYDKKNVASNHVHPVLAAMFLLKLNVFDYHMLISNFGRIIKYRNEKRQIDIEADSLLMYDATTDPNDVVCEINSPIADILNRYKVQIALWDVVLKLRSGVYYDAASNDKFMDALNLCRNNLYDNADLAYNYDEGSFIRRLMSVFSLRPIFISISPISSVATFAVGPSHVAMNTGQKAFGFNNQVVKTITTLPMLTLEIPSVQTGENINLQSATAQTMWINENGTIVPKEQTVIGSKEVLIFYVNRRDKQITIRTFANPINFSHIPLTMSGFENLNSHRVDVPEIISIGASREAYSLRSVVAVTETEIYSGDQVNSIITGSTALIMTHRDFQMSVYESKYYLYDPFGASIPVRHPDGSGYITNKPISTIEGMYTPDIQLTGGIPNPSFADRAARNGTIFIYAKAGGYRPRELVIG